MDIANKKVSGLIFSKAIELDTSFSILYNAIKVIGSTYIYHDLDKNKKAIEVLIYKTCVKAQIDKAVNLHLQNLSSQDPLELKVASVMLSDAIPAMPDNETFMEVFNQRQEYLESITGLKKARNVDLIQLTNTTAEIEKLVTKHGKVYFYDLLVEKCNPEIEQMVTLALVLQGGYTQEEVQNIYKQ